MNIDTVKNIAILAARKASQKIMEIYETNLNSSDVWYKADESPLTIADISSNNIIQSILSKNYPEIPLLSEELEADDNVLSNAEYCWVIDPLDGTKEFLNKNGEFTVNIALVKNGTPILGVVSIPVANTLYYAVKGQGAYKVAQNGAVAKITVSAKLDHLIWVGSKSHSSEKEKTLIDSKKEIFDSILSIGSSLKGLMVAEGTADVYYRFGNTCEWDTCAMQCICEEAGAIVRQIDGSLLTYNRKNHLNEKGFYIVNRKENIWL